LFANTAIVFSLALSCAAKIEAEHRNAAPVQRLGRLIHNFVVHGATEKRMRVADHRRERRSRSRDGPEKSFEPSGGTRDENGAMEYSGHEITNAAV
jgi:hypothetical protein